MLGWGAGVFQMNRLYSSSSSFASFASPFARTVGGWGGGCPVNYVRNALMISPYSKSLKKRKKKLEKVAINITEVASET